MLIQSLKVSDLVLWLWSADLSKKANRPPLTFPPLNMKICGRQGTAACSYLRPNAIYILKKLKPSPEHHFCCLVPTTKAIIRISRGWLWIFWYCYVLGTWDVFVFRNCFCKCWSPVALQKPHKGHSWADLKFRWCHEPQTSWEQLLFCDSRKPRAEELLDSQSSRCRGMATSPCQLWLAQLHDHFSPTCELFLTLPFPTVFSHQTTALGQTQATETMSFCMLLERAF